MTYSYDITARPVELGGGWRLRLLEDYQEVGGGIFPAADSSEAALQTAFDEAEATAYEWLDSRDAT